MSMAVASLRRWFVLHRWSSLICTLFLLLVCITGLPMLFEEQIFDTFAGDTDPVYASLPPDTPDISLDVILSKAHALYPGQIVTSLAPDDDEPAVLVFMAPSWQALKDDAKYSDRHVGHWLKFDARTAALVEQSPPADHPAPRRWIGLVLGICTRLHMNLFAGVGGALFMGLMAASFVLSLVSGMVLYGRFMRRLPFATIRRQRSARLGWLDLHNLLGAAILVWALVVGFTGLVNELQTPLFGLWHVTDVRRMVTPWMGQPVAPQASLASLQSAFDTVQQALPNNRIGSVSFPGAPFNSPRHYLLWTQGNTPLTARLFTPVLVDAQTGRLQGIYPMPWYLRALELSRPLHFGDYGGLPLKILWALLDLVVIGVLISGLLLWLDKRRVATDVHLRMLGVEMDKGGDQ